MQLLQDAGPPQDSSQRLAHALATFERASVQVAHKSPCLTTQTRVKVLLPALFWCTPSECIVLDRQAPLRCIQTSEDVCCMASLACRAARVTAVGLAHNPSAAGLTTRACMSRPLPCRKPATQTYRWRWECCAASQGSTALPGMPSGTARAALPVVLPGCCKRPLPRSTAGRHVAADVALRCGR